MVNVLLLVGLSKLTSKTIKELIVETGKVVKKKAVSTVKKPESAVEFEPETYAQEEERLKKDKPENKVYKVAQSVGKKFKEIVNGRKKS